MAWEGKSLAQICEQLKDRNRNGSRDIPALIKHVTSDSLVLWGWKPGRGREPAPGTPAEFGELMQALPDVPFVVETPGGKAGHARDIATLKGLRTATS